jgi:hypothetical protein
MAIVPMKSSPTPEMVRYSLAWRNPHTQPPGPRVLHAVLVTRGEKCPQEILDLWSPGCGYAVTWELVTQRPIRRWSKEARGRVRRKNRERRMTVKFPLSRSCSSRRSWRSAHNITTAITNPPPTSRRDAKFRLWNQTDKMNELCSSVPAPVSLVSLTTNDLQTQDYAVEKTANWPAFAIHYCIYGYPTLYIPIDKFRSDWHGPTLHKR